MLHLELELKVVLSRRARLSSRPGAHPDADVFEAVRGGTSDDLPHAHARPVLVYTSRANFMGGRSWHATGGDADRGVWGVYDTTRLGLDAVYVGGYALVWFLVNDRVKLLAYRVFDPTAELLLAKQHTDVTPADHLASR